MKSYQKPMQLNKKRENENQICRKQSNGGFKCPSSEPPSVVMAIPLYPLYEPSILIQSPGEFVIVSSFFKIILKDLSKLLQILTWLIYMKKNISWNRVVQFYSRMSYMYLVFIHGLHTMLIQHV